MFRIANPWILAFLLLCSWGSVTHAATACRGLYQGAKYAKAGACYLASARRLSTPQARLRKGRAMRNAALCYAKAAENKKQHTQAKRLFWYEKAARILHQYLKAGLAVNAYRVKSATALRKKFLRRVGYSVLTVLAEHPKARILLQGYRYRSRGKRRLRRWLRPGQYKVQVVFPGLRPQLRRVVLKRLQRRRMSFLQPLKAGGVVPRQPPLRRVPPRRRPPVHDFDPDAPQPPDLRARTAPPVRRKVVPTPRVTPKRAAARRKPPPRPRVRAGQPSVDELLRGFAPPSRRAALGTAKPVPPVAKPPLHKGRIALFVIASLGAVAVGVGVGLYATSNQPYSEATNIHGALVSDGTVSGTTTTDNTRNIAEKVRTAQTMQSAGIAIISAGGVAAIIGLIWGLALPARHQPATPGPTAREWEVPE